MRKLLLASMITLAGFVSAQEQLLLVNEGSTGLRDGVVSVIDLNGNGKYNIIFAGRSNKGADDNVYIYESKGDGTLSLVDNTGSFPGGKWLSYSWIDTNNDGKIDLFASGEAGGAMGSFTKLLTNNGNGSFTDNWELDLPQRSPGSAAADFDNDGIVDFISYGFKTEGTLNFRKADGTIDESINIIPNGVTLFGDVNITLVDINNDGFLDFYVCGYVHDADAKRRYSALFLNNGDRTFTETNDLDPGKSSNQATALFADLDQDGWMDMVFYGHEGSGSMYVYMNIYDEETKTCELVEAKKVDGIYQTKTVPNSGVLADINNDGLYDLVANVYNGINNNPRERVFFFLGTGESVDFFSLNETMSGQMMGASNGAVNVFDCNGDGVLDFAVMGYNYNQNNNDAFCAIYKNTTYTASNEAPGAPSNLQNTVDGNAVTLAWNAATDDKTPVPSLSYNMYLKNKTNGKYYRTPNADLSTGRRFVYEHGNAFLAQSVSFNNLPDGEYEWTVQAIDAAYAGGSFAEMKTFTIGKSSLKDPLLSDVVVTVEGQSLIVVTAEEVQSLRLHNSKGAEVCAVKGSNVLQIPAITKGVYVVKIQIKDQTLMKKIVL